MKVHNWIEIRKEKPQRKDTKCLVRYCIGNSDGYLCDDIYTHLICKWNGESFISEDGHSYSTNFVDDWFEIKDYY